MTSRVGPDGQVVIPRELRDELGIEPGDAVEVWRDGDGIRMRVVAERTSLHGRFAGHNLIAERRADLAREDARDAQW